MWAVDRVAAAGDPLAEARAIHSEQRALDAAIADAGVPLIAKGARVLTHCNTGPIATAGGGTALGVIIAAHRAGKKPRVFVDETRPLLQGARLNTVELQAAGVETVLQVDGAAAIAMQRQGIDLVIVGADRIARNGDTANKIGTYGLGDSCRASRHSVLRRRAALDVRLWDFQRRRDSDRGTLAGRSYVVSQRARRPEGTHVYNPAFDVTPGHLDHRLHHGVRHRAAAVCGRHRGPGTAPVRAFVTARSQG